MRKVIVKGSWVIAAAVAAHFSAAAMGHTSSIAQVADGTETKRPNIARADGTETKRPNIALADGTETKRPNIALADGTETKRPNVDLHSALA